MCIRHCWASHFYKLNWIVVQHSEFLWNKFSGELTLDNLQFMNSIFEQFPLTCWVKNAELSHWLSYWSAGKSVYVAKYSVWREDEASEKPKRVYDALLMQSVLKSFTVVARLVTIKALGHWHLDGSSRWWLLHQHRLVGVCMSVGTRKTCRENWHGNKCSEGFICLVGGHRKRQQLADFLQ